MVSNQNVEKRKKQQIEAAGGARSWSTRLMKNVSMLLLIMIELAAWHSRRGERRHAVCASCKRDCPRSAEETSKSALTVIVWSLRRQRGRKKCKLWDGPRKRRRGRGQEGTACC